MGDLETHHKFLEIPCGTKLLRVLIFAIFPLIRKISSRKKKLLQNLYSRSSIYNLKCSTEELCLSGVSVRVCNRLTKKSNLT